MNESKSATSMKKGLKLKDVNSHVLFTKRTSYNFTKGCNFSLGAKIICPNVDILFR